MELKKINVNRFIYKMDPSPVEENPVYMSVQVGSNRNRQDQNNRSTNSEKEAREIITGTVIMNCIIITSALPSRVEIAGNDITFYDDTTGDNGTFTGDTSRLIFTRADRSEGTFIMEKRVSINDTLDSVLSWYVTAPVLGHHNWMFIGRDGDDDNTENKNLSVLRIAVNGKSTDVVVDGKPYGSFSIEYDEESVSQGIVFFGGSSRNLIGSGLTGFTSFILCGDGGWSGIGYKVGALNNLVLYVDSATGKINVDAPIIVNEANGGRMSVGKVTDAGPMTNTNGSQGDIVFNISNSKFYGCTLSGTPATWVAFH